MEFDRIKVHKGAVELDYTEVANGAKRVVTEKDKDPTAALRGALQAFTGYALWVLSAPESWSDYSEVMSVSISRPEDMPRGITVAVLKKCSRARNSTTTFNTPYLSQRPDEAKGDGTGFLPAHVPDLIDALEKAAEEYHDGERGEGQTELPIGDTDNSKQVGERMSEASVASTKKPKGKKKDQVPGVGTVHNPESTEVLEDDGVRKLLLTVDRDVPIDAIPTWTSSERDAAICWAKMRQRELVGSLKPDEKMPAEPPCLLRVATPPLPQAAEWDEKVAVDGAGVKEIKTAAKNDDDHPID